MLTFSLMLPVHLKNCNNLRTSYFQLFNISNLIAKIYTHIFFPFLWFLFLDFPPFKFYRVPVLTSFAAFKYYCFCFLVCNVKCKMSIPRSSDNILRKHVWFSFYLLISTGVFLEFWKNYVPIYFPPSLIRQFPIFPHSFRLISAPFAFISPF